MNAPLLAAPPQPRTYGPVNWVGLRTLLWREVGRFLKVAGQTIFAPLVSSVLYMMIFSVVMRGREAPLGEVDFATFLAPGLIMLGIINNAFANSSSSVIIAKMQGNATDFLMSPLSALELALAFIGGAVVRGLLVGLVSAVALAPFADVWPQNLAAVLYYGLLAAVIFGALGLMGGVWADKFDKLATVTNFVILPLTFLSGTFYAIDALPEPFRSIGHWNPVFFLIDGFRMGFVGEADGPWLLGAAVSFLIAAALCLGCWALLRSGWKLKA